MVQIPHFPECKHSIVKSLAHHTDQELLTLFQRKPESGQYFLAIFCRYSPIVYTLIQHSARSPVQAHYLFALTWRHIYHELRGLTLSGQGEVSDRSEQPQSSQAQSSQAQSLQTWLINITAVCINSAQIPPTESIHYSLEKASPPLWCYLEQSLSQLSPTQRLVILLAQTFHWSTPRISAYLQAEGEALSREELTQVLQMGYRELTDRLPEDIQTIYLSELTALSSSAPLSSVPASSTSASSDGPTIVATSE